MSKLLIKGVPPGQEHAVDGAPRLEITEFVKDHKQFSLYCQALNHMMYEIPHTDRGSYFSIAGIHGFPLSSWNETGKPTEMFCNHWTEFFLPWHRPYVAVYEQEVQRHARDIAAKYTTQDRLEWQKAAANLRQPYWGWEEYATAIPPDEVILKQEVDITYADGTTKPAKNPLFSYKFPDGVTKVFPAPFNTLNETVRHYSKGASQPADLKARLGAFTQLVHDDVKKTFALTTWDYFSSGGLGANGMEAIHGRMHVNVGGPIGHMRALETAAFDPLFWMHHANVDRLLDLWHSKHQLWSPPKEGLVPFWSTQTAYWQSEQITNAATTFNYSYHNVLTQQRPVVASVKNVPATIFPLSTENEVPQTLLNLTEANLPTESVPAAALSAASSITLNVPEEEATMKDWIVRVRCTPYELGGSFTIYCFLDEIPADPKDWLDSPGFAGSYEVFANGNPQSCPNCIQQTATVLNGYIPCNYTLLSHMDEPSLDEDVVIPFLKKKLTWAVIKANREVVDLSKFPSLEVSVTYCTLTLPVGADVPTRSEPKAYHKVDYGSNVPKSKD